MAAGAFAKAVAREPDKLRLRYQLIDALLNSGDTGRVGPACDEMLRDSGIRAIISRPWASPDSAGWPAWRSSSRRRSRSHTTWQRRRTTTLRVNILGNSGQWDLIAEYRARIVKDKPGDASAQFNLGFALAAQGKLNEASAAYREQLRLSPTAMPATTTSA